MSLMAKVSKLRALLQAVESLKKKPDALNDQSIKNIENTLALIDKINMHPEEKFAHTYDPTDHKELLNYPDRQEPANKIDIIFQFGGRLKSLILSTESQSTLDVSSASSSGQNFQTPPSSPRKKSPPVSPSKLKSPSKIPSRALGADFELEKRSNLLLERDVAAATSTKAYLEKILHLDEKIREVIASLEKEIQTKRQAMKSYFQVLMVKNNLPYYEDHAESLLGELFDIVYRDKGTYEKLVVALSQGYALKLANHPWLQAPLTSQETAKLILEVRNEVIINNPDLFKELGQVTEKPENYFELTPDAKILAHDFIESLYASPDQIAVMSVFQREKEKSIKLGMIDKILSMSVQLYYQEILFIQNLDGSRNYIQDIQDIQDLEKIKLVPWVEIKQNISANLQQRLSLTGAPVNQELILKELEQTYEAILRNFNAIPAASEQNTCISFFPIKIEYYHADKPSYICLVTTSGDLNKLSDSDIANKRALEAFQNSLKAFSAQYTRPGIDGVQYNFVYFDTENGSIDILLQQLSKGMTGNFLPFSSIHPECEGVLSDPFRACAEKKFVAFVRKSLNDPDVKTFKILGAANLRMPILPLPTDQFMFNQSVRDLHQEILNFVEMNSKNSLYLESATFKNYLTDLCLLAEVKTLKANGKEFFDKWKALYTDSVNIIDKFCKTEVDMAALEVIQNAFLNKVSIPDGLLSDNPKFELNELCRKQIIFLQEKMTEFFKVQKEFIAFKQQISIKSQEHLDSFSALSSSMGKTYKQVRDSVIFLISKIKSPGGFQKCRDICFFELSYSAHEKQVIRKTIYKHRQNILALYDNWIVCLNKRLEADLSLELKAQDLEKFKQFFDSHKSIIFENISHFPESMANEFILSFRSLEKRFMHSFSVIDKAGQPRFSTAELIKSYSHEKTWVENEIAIPVSFPIIVNGLSAESFELETNFIDCCAACKANKLPVLTWLTDLQHKKQAKHRFSESMVVPFSVCSSSPESIVVPRPPEPCADDASSFLSDSSPTTLTPGFHSFSLSGETGAARLPAVERSVMKMPQGRKLNFE